jgi:lipopolysaccharide exporter
MSIQRAIVKGTAWLVAARWLVRGIGFVSTIILARLLVPADFGLVALAMMLTGLIGVLGETGLMYYLIRETNPERSHFDTVWTLQTLFGAALMVAVLALAPLFQHWTDKPDLALTMQFLSITLLLQGAHNPGVVWFRKNMEFGRDFLTILFPKIAGFVTTLSLAYAWRSHWALICGILASNVMFFAQSYVMHPFRPRISLARVRDVWSFSIWSLVHAIFEYLAEQIDTLILGRFKSSRAVGLYHVAYDVAGSPLVELSQPLSRVLMPAYVKIQDDAAELARVFNRVFSGLALLAFAIGAGAALVAEDAVLVILGPQWAESAPLMQILAPSCGAFALIFPLYTFLISMGRPKLAAYITIAQVILLAAVLTPLAMHYDLREVAIGRLAVVSLLLVGSLAIFARVAHLSAGTILASLWRPALAALVMSAAVASVEVATSDWLPVLRLIASIATGASAFIATVLAAWALAGRPETIERDLLAIAWRAAGR